MPAQALAAMATLLACVPHGNRIELQLDRGGAVPLGIMSNLNRRLERRMRNADHDRHAAADALDGAMDQRLALLESEIGIFLGLDPGCHHHRRPAIVDDVVDLPL